MSDLQSDVYTPNKWKCKECGAEITKNFLALDGAVAVDKREYFTACPNDGLMMFRVTWQEEAETAIKFAIAQMNENEQLRAKLAQANKTSSRCPYIVSSTEGTSYCALAEQRGAHEERNAP